MLSSTEAAWMLSYEVMGGPLADASVWRGALLWAIALYVPLSAPLSTLESSLEESELPGIGASTGAGDQQPAAGPRHGRCHPARIQLGLGAGWASSLGVVAVGWSVLLILANAGKDD